MKELIKKYGEPFCFYGLRLLRTALFYVAYVACVTIGTHDAPFGDPEMINYDPLTHHLMASSAVLLAFLLLTWAFSFYDPTARRRFCENPPTEKHRFSEWLWVLRSYEFLCDAVGLFILPLIVKNDFFAHPLYLFFGRDDFSAGERYLRCVLTVFPLLLLANSLMRSRVRNHFRSLRKKKDIKIRFEFLQIVFFTAVIVIGYGELAMEACILVIPMVLILALHLVSLLFGFLFGNIRAFWERLLFLHRLKAICRKNNYSLSKVRRPLRSVFFQKNHDASFTVKAGEKIYVCKLLANTFPRSQMIFLDKTLGYFKAGMYFRGEFYEWFKRRFYYDFDAEAEDGKILIVSTKPYRMAAAETEIAFQTKTATHLREIPHYRELDNADTVHGTILYTGKGFLNALARGGLTPRYR